MKKMQRAKIKLLFWIWILNGLILIFPNYFFKCFLLVLLDFAPNINKKNGKKKKEERKEKEKESKGKLKEVGSKTGKILPAGNPDLVFKIKPTKFAAKSLGFQKFAKGSQTWKGEPMR